MNALLAVCCFGTSWPTPENLDIGDPGVARTSEPVGPGNDYRCRSYQPPLPPPASQSKRRKRARQTQGRR